jgi:ABC-type transporter Mla maintaining outer membrane lipid asymmetry ATPase subunit MlaF
VADGKAPVVSLRSVVKDYRGLRPLRVQSLDLGAADRTAILGLDRDAAQVLVDLITGSAVPDTGEVTAFGRDTREITDAEAWMASLTRFGLFTERTVFIEQFTAEQNLALPLTLALESLDDTVRATVRQIAADVGLSSAELAKPAESLGTLQRARLRLGRTLALGPRLLLLEHPTATLDPADVAAFADTMSSVVLQRKLAVLVLTADKTFARAVARTVLTLQPGTGALAGEPAWRRWLS